MVKRTEANIHIWNIEINDYNVKKAYDLSNLLSYEEREKAKTFKFQPLKENFILVRVVLRIIISIYLKGVRPDEIYFAKTTYGKPYLAVPKCNLHFNLSHSDKQLAIAVSDQAVGIDIEEVREMIDLEEMINCIFSNNEINLISSKSQQDITRIFYRCWTKKEAFIKAIGLGLTLDLKSIDSSLQEIDYQGYKWAIEQIQTNNPEVVGHISYRTGIKRNIIYQKWEPDIFESWYNYCLVL